MKRDVLYRRDTQPIQSDVSITDSVLVQFQYVGGKKRENEGFPQCQTFIKPQWFIACWPHLKIWLQSWLLSLYKFLLQRSDLMGLWHGGRLTSLHKRHL